MAQKTKANLTLVFETGDTPGGSDFADLIDSQVNTAETTIQTMLGPLVTTTFGATNLSANTGAFTTVYVSAGLSARNAEFGTVAVSGGLSATRGSFGTLFVSGGVSGGNAEFTSVAVSGGVSASGGEFTTFTATSARVSALDVHDIFFRLAESTITTSSFSTAHAIAVRASVAGVSATTFWIQVIPRS